ncbi:hypothetical protein CDL12_14849 [Handroanthus impetiginosus]|uniref:Transmembrane protein n=1 Tax=Handroanthus impetiginosus TaxID=429701 RepID=A0A2G9H5E1_9LAMI|nr:hypothetical protein CDL12_14849 [Handroanthus impetiginosus]
MAQTKLFTIIVFFFFFAIMTFSQSQPTTESRHPPPVGRHSPVPTDQSRLPLLPNADFSSKGGPSDSGDGHGH